MKGLNREYYKISTMLYNILEYIFVYCAYYRIVKSEIVKSEIVEVGSLRTVVNNKVLHSLSKR